MILKACSDFFVYQIVKDGNIELSRYGFQRCSNIIEWVNHFEHELLKKGLTKFSRLLEELNPTYWEPNEPKEFGLYGSLTVEY